MKGCSMFKKAIIHKNTSAKISALLCLLCGAALFFLAGNGMVAIPVLAQAISIILIVAAVYIAAAYLLREYTYSIEPNAKVGEDEEFEDKYDIIIHERKSNKQVKVCHIELSDVTAINIIDPKNRKKIRSERKNMKRYTYDTKFAASMQIEIRAVIDDEEYSIIVSYDEELLAALKKFGK